MFGTRRWILGLALSSTLLACGGGSGGARGDGGGGGEAGWVYHEIAGAACGNGSAWGVATNLRPGATDVVVFLAGGGACWDAESCFALGAAVHIDEDVGEATVVAEAEALEPFLFSRQTGTGPFAEASFVYVPYCTGDLHAGRRVADYDVLGQTRSVHHVGAENLDALLARWDDLLPQPERLWLSGASAGGFGAALNWWRFRQRFPQASAVHVIDDSGPPIDVPAARFADWVGAWDLEQPADCADCADGFSRLLPHYAQALPSGDRFAYLGFANDSVIALYYGDGTDVIGTKLSGLRTTLEGDARFGGFFLEGTDHVVLSNPQRATAAGLSAATWVEQFVTAAPEWTTTGP